MKSLYVSALSSGLDLRVRMKVTVLNYNGNYLFTEHIKDTLRYYPSLENKQILITSAKLNWNIYK